jgi:hypothetical protein
MITSGTYEDGKIKPDKAIYDEWREATRIRKESNPNNPHPFRKISEALGLQFIDKIEIVDPSTVDHSSSAPRQITYPHLNDNTDDNFLDIAVGSVINIGGHSLRVTATGIEVVSTDDADVDVEKGPDMAEALSNILYAAAHSNVSFGDTELNDDALELLRDMGIDTTKTFKINTSKFVVDDGIIQGAVYNSKEKPYGTNYLNALLKKAYEQNMIYDELYPYQKT